MSKPTRDAYWQAAHTDYSVCLFGGSFAARHGGECDFYDGAIYGSRSSAQRECNRRNRLSRRDAGLRELVAAVTRWQQINGLKGVCEVPNCPSCRVERALASVLAAYPFLRGGREADER